VSSSHPWQRQLTYHPEEPVPDNVTARPVLRRVLLTGVAVSLFTFCGLVLSATITGATGVTGVLLGVLAASTAIGVVVPVFLWIDRLEAEPARVLWFSFLWGALVSTVGALVLNQAGIAIFAELAVDPVVAGAVLVAPLVEEALKCLGVLMVFWFARREFNGVVDGMVYAGITAAGFAFTENILYLGSNYAEFGAPGLLGVFILRCLMSPFAHPMFTVCFGLALGLASYRRGPVRYLLPAAGFAAAVFLHGLWNFAAVTAGSGFFVVYAVVQVPLFLAFVALLLWARRRESRLITAHLTDYGINGWFTPAEVAMLASARERRAARRWARSVGGRRAEAAMEAFQDEATELAVARRHIVRGDPDPVWRHKEARLLAGLHHHRAAFLPTPPPVIPPVPGPPTSGSAGGVGVPQQ
jgi:RsiW-degrading membrane proteinase PrsW (M82 family)